MKTIQGKILFVVISALVVITLIVTSISVTITHEIMHKDADRILNNVAQKEVAQIDDMLNDFVKSVAIMEHYVSHELISSGSLSDQEYLAEYTEKIRHLFDEVAYNTSGASSYYLCFSPELTGITSGFYCQYMEDGSVYELSKDDFSKLSLITDEELVEYSNAKSPIGGSWVEPHPSRFTKEMVVSYVLPVYSKDDFVGILGFNMDFDYLLDRVNSISVYENGCALLIGEDMETCYNTSKKTEIYGEYTKATQALVNGMNLELRAGYKDIQSGIRPMLTHIVIAFLVVLVLSIIYTFWVTSRIVKPLKELTKAAGNISSGIQEVEFIIDSKDEVGILSRVLNDTYGKIREYSEYINALAFRDSLTGIKNSTAYTEAIEQLNKEINLGNPSFGVIVADINNLKKTNDTYGHDVGNELIIHSAKILTDTFKTSAIFRIGGDEFAVVLKGRDFENYRTLIEKMDAAFSADYIEVGDKRVDVSIARGVALFDSSIDHVYTDVFLKADHAMYMHKKEMKAQMA
ncbi:MAG: diguanylate cyclase [Ruminococcaceae bacterium]|nr:diguanylate cyclase [Oscillospiraceae bacterium]